ncbi:MAG: substrate-binding domain-containing protein [Clostridiales bacterium]|jgi:phosphate transport system substrate-binding protein|nr:substrate-binding domain-containing protein [Clostridiales bacterium]
MRIKNLAALFVLMAMLSGCVSMAGPAGAASASAEAPAASASVEESAASEPVEDPTGVVSAPPTESEIDVTGLKISEDEYPRVDGSTAMIPLGEAVAAVMMEKDRADCAQYAEFNRTYVSYTRLVDNEADILIVMEKDDQIGDYIKEKGVQFGLEIEPVGRDALAFMVNTQNPVDNLTTQQLVDIYSGKITNWAEVGGEQMEIAAFQRNSTAGSQTLMKKLVMHDTPMLSAPESLFVFDSMDTMFNAIADYDNGPASIGYNAYYFVTTMRSDPNVKLISVDGVFPDQESISSGAYPLGNDFYTVIRDNALEDSPERLLFRWLQSAEGNALVAAEGYSTIN